jgi:hypothetical protein
VTTSEKLQTLIQEVVEADGPVSPLKLRSYLGILAIVFQAEREEQTPPSERVFFRPDHPGKVITQAIRALEDSWRIHVIRYTIPPDRNVIGALLFPKEVEFLCP